MPAAYLRAPEVPALTVVLTTFAAGCSGKVQQGRQQAGATVARRRQGTVYPCRTCGAWHTSRFFRPLTPRWQRVS